MLRTSLRYGLHPHMPLRLGFKGFLRLVNPSVAELIDKTDAYTLVPARNRITIHRVASEVLDAGVPGDFMEIGVHRGGSAAILAHVLRDQPDRLLWLFDRWGDLPQTTEKDGHRQQEYARENISDKLARIADERPMEAARHIIETEMKFDRARFMQGWYDETFATYPGNPIAFASIDCDYYESVALSLAFVQRHASPGCRMVIDDYDAWPGARAATNEFAERADLKVEQTGLGTAILTLP